MNTYTYDVRARNRENGILYCPCYNCRARVPSTAIVRRVLTPEVWRVTWMNWEEAWKLPQAGCGSEHERAVIDEMRRRGLRFSGDAHQHRPGCAPVVAGCALALSMRGWGGLMADVLEHRVGDDYRYVDWAWSTPEGEEEVLP